MLNIVFNEGALDAEKQAQLSEGFEFHSEKLVAPQYSKEKFSWSVQNEQGKLIAALTADVLWEWLYVDELWVDESCRGTGIGKQLMQAAEEFAKAQLLSGLWLWTQSWQAPDFYLNLGYEEFTRFDNFPTGYSRIGFRKQLK